MDGLAWLRGISRWGRSGACSALLLIACGKTTSGSGDEEPDTSSGVGGSGSQGSGATAASGSGANSGSGGANAGGVGTGGVSTGGGDWGDTGGLGGLGGTGGGVLVGGNLPPLEDLVGDYDISFLGPLEEIEGCTPLITETHWNLHLSLDDLDFQNNYRVEVFKDFDVYSRSNSIIAESNETYVRLASKSPDTPTVVLYGTLEGFTYAAVYVPYECPGADDGSVMLHFSKVVPDETPPKIRLWTHIPGDHAFSFSSLFFAFSEPLRSPSDGFVISRFEDSTSAYQSMSLSNASGAIPHAWSSDSGGNFGMYFLDRESIGGDVTLHVGPELTDRAGNSAVMRTDTFTVKNVGGVLESEITFDDGPPSGLLGAATYVASGAPCETGGCIVLEGSAPRCSDFTDTPAVWGLRVDYGTGTRTLVLRYRLLSSSSLVPSPLVREEYGTSGNEDYPLPFEVSEGPYTHTSGWTDRHVPPSSPLNHHDAGIAIGIGCTEQAVQPQVKLVIDRVELLENP